MDCLRLKLPLLRRGGGGGGGGGRSDMTFDLFGPRRLQKAQTRISAAFTSAMRASEGMQLVVTSVREPKADQT
jgi:hypothetical protein